MRSSRTKAIIRKIAQDEGLTIKQVEEITNSFFRFVVKQMSSGDRWTLTFKDIRLFKFGMFKVTPTKRKHTEAMNPNLIKKREKLNRNQRRGPNHLPGGYTDQGVQGNMEPGSVKK